MENGFGPFYVLWLRENRVKKIYKMMLMGEEGVVAWRPHLPYLREGQVGEVELQLPILVL